MEDSNEAGVGNCMPKSVELKRPFMIQTRFLTILSSAASIGAQLMASAQRLLISAFRREAHFWSSLVSLDQ